MRYREIRTLAREHDRDELTDIVVTLKRDFEEWRDEFDVETPDELLANVADNDVSDRRSLSARRSPRTGSTPNTDFGLIKDALARYNRLTARPPATA